MVDIKALIDKGGVYYNIVGSNPAETLADAVRTVQVDEGINKDELLKAILMREELMPTAVGSGIAIPHPRNPLVMREEWQQVSVCFLQDPVDFKALDRKPVSTLFLLLSATPKLHLQILSQLSYLCQREDFLELIAQKPGKKELLAFIERAESSWK